jgi:riboflavin kinase/FMN adenylyltransferase
MNLHTDIDHLPQFNKAVVTIGTFDGVHLGHQQIIAQLKAEAERIGGETVIITFHPHPRKIVHANQDVRLITTIEERIELLTEAGIDHLVIVPFTHNFSELEPRQYVETFLKKRFDPAIVIIGYDHKFGKDRKGDYKLLEDYSAKGFFELKEIPQHVINHITVSSTRVREYILNGEIGKANELLGYDFSFEGTVVKGDQIGRTLGYPTANIHLMNNEKIVPGNGIYAVRTLLGRVGKPGAGEGMMSIGIRPTVGGTNRTIEVNIFNFNEDIYEEKIRVYVKAFIRPEMKFSGLDELKKAIDGDKKAATAILGASTDRR